MNKYDDTDYQIEREESIEYEEEKKKTVGEKINNLFNQANDIIKQRLEEANNLEEKVAK